MIDFESSVVLVGIEPRPVRAERSVGGGGPGLHLVGLRDAAFREAKGRVRRVTRTTADLDTCEAGGTRHIEEALVPRGEMSCTTR